MEDFITEIEDRIKLLQQEPTDINIGKVSELALVVKRLKTLSIPVSCQKLKEGTIPTFDYWCELNNVGDDPFGYIYKGKFHRYEELYRKYIEAVT